MPSACDSVIEDIEDMVSFNDPTPQDRQSARKRIIPRSRKKNVEHEELQADRSVKQTVAEMISRRHGVIIPRSAY